MVTNHTTGKNFDNLLNFGGKDAFIMQNIRNCNHPYIARFEASSKYVRIKCRLIKRCYTKNLSLQIVKI